MNPDESTQGQHDQASADTAPHNPYATPQYEKLTTGETVSNGGCLRNVLLFSYLLFPLVALYALSVHGLEDFLGAFFFWTCIVAVPPVTLFSLIYLVVVVRSFGRDGAKRPTASTLLVALVSISLFPYWIYIITFAYELLAYNERMNQRS